MRRYLTEVHSSLSKGGSGLPETSALMEQTEAGIRDVCVIVYIFAILETHWFA